MNRRPNGFRHQPGGNRRGLPGQPGGPPKSGGGDWRAVLPELVGNLLDLHRTAAPLKGLSEFRKGVINDLRLALDSEVPDRSMRDAARQAGPEMFGVAEVVRWLLLWGDFDWRSPAAAETVMVEAQRALDAAAAEQAAELGPKADPMTGRRPTWQAQVGKLCGEFRRMNPGEGDAAVRAKALEALEEAFGPTPSAKLMGRTTVEAGDGSGPEEVDVAAPSVIWRMVLWGFDVNWYLPGNARAVRDVVDRHFGDAAGGRVA